MIQEEADETGVPLRLSREDLYELAWSKPMSELAKDFSISDVALAKRCRKLGIPVPGRGYWARIDAGQKPHRPILPKRDAQQGDSAQLIVASNSAPSFETQYPTNEATDRPWLDERLAYERLSANAIPVPEQTQKWHPVVAVWRDELQKAAAKLEASRLANERYKKWPQWRKAKESDHDGYYWRIVEDRGQRLLDSHRAIAVRVSSAAYQRALSILNGFALAADIRGFTVHDDDESGRIVLKGHDAAVQLRLSELLEDKTRTEKSYNGTMEQRHYKVPSGRLRITLQIGYGDGPQFTDSGKDVLEGQLNKVYSAIYRLVVKAWRTERAHREQQRRWDEEKRQREEQLRLEAARKAEIAAERQRRRGLLTESLRWSQANRIRNYLHHIRSSQTAAKGGAELHAWLDWAGIVADDLDPTHERLSVLPQL